MFHFYGMTPDQQDALDVFTYADLWNGITMIEAQQFLVQLKLHTASNLKSADFKTLHKDHHRLAYPSWYGSKQNTALTAKELAEKMALRARHGR